MKHTLPLQHGKIFQHLGANILGLVEDMLGFPRRVEDTLLVGQDTRLNQANTDLLETWGERVLDAKSLEEVFDETRH